MNNLTVDKAAAQKLFAEADASGKNLLKALCGEETFAQKITDQVKTFEDACAVLGIMPFNPTGTADEVAYIKLKTIIKALNEGWVPNWDDMDEKKYCPWWIMEGGFSLDDVRYRCGYSFVSSRLCFKSEELAQYAAKQFHELYKEYFTL